MANIVVALGNKGTDQDLHLLARTDWDGSTTEEAQEHELLRRKCTALFPRKATYVVQTRTPWTHN